MFHFHVDCWHQEPHFRPTFADILKALEEVKLSAFMSTPQDSFHTLQEDWRVEIEEMFDELRSREKVMNMARLTSCAGYTVETMHNTTKMCGRTLINNLKQLLIQYKMLPL